MPSPTQAMLPCCGEFVGVLDNMELMGKDLYEYEVDDVDDFVHLNVANALSTGQ
ncbi:hypothetical protein GCM10027021_14150 [Dyella kyungheensis]|jgi:hypothetical protein